MHMPFELSRCAITDGSGDYSVLQNHLFDLLPSIMSQHEEHPQPAAPSQRSEGVICNICYSGFTRHKRTPFEVCTNGHIVCRRCLMLIRRSRRCPFCRQRIVNDNIKVKREIFEELSEVSSVEEGQPPRDPGQQGDIPVEWEPDPAFDPAQRRRRQVLPQWDAQVDPNDQHRQRYYRVMLRVLIVTIPFWVFNVAFSLFFRRRYCVPTAEQEDLCFAPIIFPISVVFAGIWAVLIVVMLLRAFFCLGRCLYEVLTNMLYVVTALYMLTSSMVQIVVCLNELDGYGYNWFVTWGLIGSTAWHWLSYFYLVWFR